jgi:hypothetical protein
MIREKVNGCSHHTSEAGRPTSGAAENMRSVVSRCHAVPNDLRKILLLAEENRARKMAMSDDRMDSSIPTLVKRGFIGLMKVGEIYGPACCYLFTALRRDIREAPPSKMD